VPFGEIEAPAGAIAGPPKGEFVMNMLGFREAADTAINIDSATLSLCRSFRCQRWPS
jgi:predicted nucleotidyltransferase